MKIRFIDPADYQQALDIYDSYMDTSITFEYETPSLAEFTRRIEEISTVYPYLVAEDEGQILGYAYAARNFSRQAYGWGAVLSIYLAPAAKGRGIGKKLYAALLELLTLQGVRVVYGLVVPPNPASCKLHEGLGFSAAACFKDTGYKNGQWLDVIWYEKRLGDDGAEPVPVIPVGKLPEAVIKGIFTAHSKVK